MIFTNVPVDGNLSCAAQWVVAQTGDPWKTLIQVDGSEKVRKMYTFQCCALKASAQVGHLGADIEKGFRDACIGSNGAISTADAYFAQAAGGSTGLSQLLGIDLGGLTDKLDAQKADITKVVIVIVMALFLLLLLWWVFK